MLYKAPLETLQRKSAGFSWFHLSVYMQVLKPISRLSPRSHECSRSESGGSTNRHTRVRPLPHLLHRSAFVPAHRRTYSFRTTSVPSGDRAKNRGIAGDLEPQRAFPHHCAPRGAHQNQETSKALHDFNVTPHPQSRSQEPLLHLHNHVLQILQQPHAQQPHG